MTTTLSKWATRELKELATEEKRRFLPYFFKTGKGQYGEGDRFLGIAVPDIRKVAKAHAKEATEKDINALLSSPYHEIRLCAVFILVQKFIKAATVERKNIYDFYLKHSESINNWDLVDLSAPHIIGTYLLDKPRDVLYKLADSKLLWDNRIAIVATQTFIRNNDLDDTFALSLKLMSHSHDLIHKATGWMLREAGKRERHRLFIFVDEHRAKMPRTMLRYAIEKFSPEERKYLMRK